MLTAEHALGIAAGALIALVGLFALLARPSSWTCRAFFLLAVMDGASTALFDIRDVLEAPRARIAVHAWYYLCFIAFSTTLLAFGSMFPKPPRRTRLLTVAAMGALGLAGAALFAFRPEWFYDVRTGEPGGIVFDRRGGSLVVSMFLYVGIAVVAWRLAREARGAPTPAMRTQAGFLLAGIVIAYGTLPTLRTLTVIGAPALELTQRAPLLLAYNWTSLAVTMSLGSLLVVVLVPKTAPERRTRRTVATGLGAMFLLGVLSLVIPDGFSWAQVLALLVFPILLAYAILRYEVFDIHARLHRAAALSLASTLAAGIFVLIENVLQGVVASYLDEGVGSTVVAGSLAAVIVAIAAVPMVRGAKVIVRRFLPNPSADALHERKMEIYANAIESLHADGIIDSRELHALAAMRRSLGISDEEHGQVLSRIARA